MSRLNDFSKFCHLYANESIWFQSLLNLNHESGRCISCYTNGVFDHQPIFISHRSQTLSPYCQIDPSLQLLSLWQLSCSKTKSSRSKCLSKSPWALKDGRIAFLRRCFAKLRAVEIHSAEPYIESSSLQWHAKARAYLKTALLSA